ncbi:MAG: 2'-5' RNA ligase family protein [Phycisphaerales bacterium]|nr:MAG: 2'-5' RNA ligase family protein [Phycisphaerales bacterium]
MARIAVDVVLLPSEEVMDMAIEANRGLLRRDADKITLNKADCLPHISLAMGCIEETDIVNLGRILRPIAKNSAPGPLTVVGASVETDVAGDTVSVFKLKRTDRLQSLHETVMRELTPYFSYHLGADMVLSPPAASESTLRWIRDYPEKSSFENFSPHITIGYGQITDLPAAIEFHAAQLALCHLANHCTCRKVLTSEELATES